MKLETHLKRLKESFEVINECIEKGLIERQQTLGFTTSAAAAEMLEAYLHKKSLIEESKNIDNFKNIDLENKQVKKFKSHVINFLRIVRRRNEKGSDKEYGFIDILKQEIKMPKDLINLLVFCTLDVKSKRLAIYSELDNGSLSEVKSIKFEIKNLK